MKKIGVVLLFVIFCSTLHAGDPKYPVFTIPAELMKDVDIVIRENKSVFRIQSKSKATWYVHQAITILNDNGKEHAVEVVGYDKLSKIKDFNGSVYDAYGKLIKRLKNSEIYDQSAYDGFSLYSDARLKAIDLSQGSYPYTVEWEYEIEYKYLFFIPGFAVLPGEKIAVEHSSYELQFPKELAPRYKTLNIDVQPAKSVLPDGNASIVWSFEKVKPIKFEPYGPPEEDITGLIMAAPSLFEYDSYSGTMNSWDEFGQWIATLNKGRNILPEQTKAKIKQLTATLSTREEKVKAIYEYLQNRTRYVSIQLGIGGFQPFEASVVDQTGYGDCKALSNYMVSMLETVGIKAHYALIEAGDDASELRTDFPSSQFNHAIVAVPNDKDTLWLECTSQTSPFGYMGTFTGDRKALLITESGAKVVNTARYTAETNLQSRVADVVLDMSGNASAKVRTTYAGIQYENSNLSHILNNQYDEQKKWLQNNTNIPNFDITNFTMVNHKNKIPSAVVNIELNLNRYATLSGKRIFLVPNLMNRFSRVPEKIENRKTAVVRRTAYTDIDTIRYHLPEGIYPEFLPEPVKLKTRFGEYEASYKVDQGSLIYVRKVIMNKGSFPAESYNEFVDFYRSMSKADNTKLVFMSKT
jgi:hypothetical protein